MAEEILDQNGRPRLDKICIDSIDSLDSTFVLLKRPIELAAKVSRYQSCELDLLQFLLEDTSVADEFARAFDIAYDRLTSLWAILKLHSFTSLNVFLFPR